MWLFFFSFLVSLTLALMSWLVLIFKCDFYTLFYNKYTPIQRELLSLYIWIKSLDWGKIHSHSIQIDKQTYKHTPYELVWFVFIFKLTKIHSNEGKIKRKLDWEKYIQTFLGCKVKETQTKHTIMREKLYSGESFSFFLWWVNWSKQTNIQRKQSGTIL